VVVCLLLGAVVLVVGLVQLFPGATTTNHRLALLVAGAALLILGESFLRYRKAFFCVALALILCIRHAEQAKNSIDMFHIVDEGA